MSVYTVTIGDHEYKVNITPRQCTVDGEVVDATILPLNPNGLQLMRRGKRALEVFLSSHENDTYQLSLQGGRYVTTRVTSSGRGRSRGRSAETDSHVLLAPMHGLVVDVAVRPGQQVEVGQTLVVLESMKMQMQLRSPRTGKVKLVNAQTGTQVEKGALLVQFENEQVGA
jgi:biotin carboxyl carrier protein